jgi:hypothetical protein
MKNNLLLFIGVLLLTACSKEDIFPNKNIEMNIDTRLPLDVNGYSHFKLYSTTTQNIHRVSGSITKNGQIIRERKLNGKVHTIGH